MVEQAELLVRGAPICTMDPGRPWAEAFAVHDGLIVAVGDESEVAQVCGPATQVLDAGEGMVLPGLVDVHSHLGFAGRQIAWELPLAPSLALAEVLAAVRERATLLEPDEWVVGGILSSAVLAAVGDEASLAALDQASLGRPVMLRDETMHNRWVNSRALAIMGVTATSAEPDGGAYRRDGGGNPVGVLLEGASTLAEAAVRASTPDTEARDRHSVRTALSIMNSQGITATMDAATMGHWLDACTQLDQAGELTGWVVACMAAREFVDPGVAGVELFDTAPERRSRHVRPDFVKGVLDGIPMTRTSMFLRPYLPASTHSCPYHGNSFYTDEQLLDLLEQAVTRRLGAKLHATADGTVRQALDAIAVIRKRHGNGPVFHIAHPEFIHPDDVARFAELGVIADASPGLWFPNPMNTAIAAQIEPHYMERIWPLGELHRAGVPIAAGCDWPAAVVHPDPWLSIQTMITRRNPDPAFPGELAADQALDLPTALRAHTVQSARAMGLANETGMLRPGLSADFIAVDRNLFQTPVDQIHRTRVLRTWFAGSLVYEAGSPSP